MELECLIWSNAASKTEETNDIVKFLIQNYFVFILIFNMHVSLAVIFQQ